MDYDLQLKAFGVKRKSEDYLIINPHGTIIRGPSTVNPQGTIVVDEKDKKILFVMSETSDDEVVNVFIRHKQTLLVHRHCWKTIDDWQMLINRKDM